MTGSQKRINIVLFYLLLLVALGGVIYFMTKPEMTCNDGIKNQGEEKTDCGGPCSPCLKKIHFKKLEIKSVEKVSDSKGSEDVLIKIYNPNEEYGAKSFRYSLDDGAVNSNIQWRKDFILPKETKYIVVNKYVSQSNDDKLIVQIDEDSINWQRVTNFRDPNLVVYNDQHIVNTSGSAYSDLTGLLVNKSAVDYETIKIKGILRNQKGNLVAASYQIMNTLPAGGKREFHIIFPMQFSEVPAQTEIEVETNIFDLENYLKTRGQQDGWDQ